MQMYAMLERISPRTRKLELFARMHNAHAGYGVFIHVSSFKVNSNIFVFCQYAPTRPVLVFYCLNFWVIHKYNFLLLTFRSYFSTRWISLGNQLNGVRLVDEGLRARYKAAYPQVDVQPASPPTPSTARSRSPFATESTPQFSDPAAPDSHAPEERVMGVATELAG